MDNQELDRIFSERLKASQEFDFREEDWDDVAQRLDAAGQKRRGGFWWLWGLALGGLLLALAWLAISLYQTQQKVAFLEQQQLNNSTSQTDTVYKEIIIHRVDTVFKTTPVSHFQTSKTSTQSFYTIHPSSKHKNSTQTTKGLSLSTELSDTEPLAQQLFPTDQQNEARENSKTALNGFEPSLKPAWSLLPLYPLSALEEGTFDELIKPVQPVEAEQEIIKKAPRKMRFRFGLEGGLSYVPGASFKGQQNYNYGLIGLFSIQDKWDLFIRLSQLHLKYASETPSEELGIPEYDYYTPNATYIQPNNIESSKSFRQYELGMTYGFGKWFFVGASWAAIHQVEQEFGFSSLILNDIESFRPESDGTASWKFNRMGLHAGGQWNFGPRWQLRPELYYYRSFDKDQDRLPHLLGIRTAVLFAF